MTSPFLTFAEVAAYLRYDLSGPNGAKQADAMRKWLAKYGCRPSLKRGLYRLALIESAVQRLDAKQADRRKRGFKTQAARFQKPSRSLHGSDVSAQPISDVHAGERSETRSGSPVNSLEQGAR